MNAGDRRLSASIAQSEHVSPPHAQCWGLQGWDCYISLPLWQDKINIKIWGRMKIVWAFAGSKEMMYIKKKSHPPSTVTDSLMVTQRANLTVLKTAPSLPSQGCLRRSEWWCTKNRTALCENVAFLKIILQCVLSSAWSSGCWNHSGRAVGPRAREGGLGERRCSPHPRGALAAPAQVQDFGGKSAQAATIIYTKSLLTVL